jgi:Endosomal/lysosomal potassium channel TMEM175
MTTDFRPARWRDDLPSVERLLSLSDNVIAFALTLLVLQVTVPPLSQVADPTSAADLAARLASETGHLVSYADPHGPPYAAARPVHLASSQ